MKGHGELGVRSGLRDFLSFSEETHSTKDVFAELRPIKEVSDWSLESGTTYVAPFEYIFDGIRRDVVGVRTTIDAGLTRVQSLAVCRATPNSFFYDPDEEFSQAVTTWDDPAGVWDTATYIWDTFPNLYIHLFNGGDPASISVVASLGFYFSGAGDTNLGDAQVHPALGDNMLDEGGLSSTAIIETALHFGNPPPLSDPPVLHTGSFMERTSDWDGNADGQIGILSFWFKTGGAFLQTVFFGSFNRFKAVIDASGQVKLTIKDSGSTIKIDTISDGSYDFNDGNWHHAVITWDASVPQTQMYVDGLDVNSPITETIATLDYTDSDWFIGNDGVDFFDGDLAQVYLNFTETIDLSVASNLAKFYDSVGDGPVSFGSNGSLPTGNSPLVFANDPLVTALNNSGYGGDFDGLESTLADADVPPNPPIDGAWEFDGASSLKKNADLTGLVNGEYGILNFWFKTTQAGAEGLILNNVSSTFGVRLTDEGQIRLTMGASTVGPTLVDIRSSRSYNDGEWHHFVASWDLNSLTTQLYVDGVSDKLVVTETAGTIDYTRPLWFIGMNESSALFYTGSLSQIYFNTVESIDLSVPSNLEKFYKRGRPINLGNPGERPTGNDPILFMNSSIANLFNNSGTGGDFDVLLGTLSEAVNPTSPTPTTTAALEGFFSDQRQRGIIDEAWHFDGSSYVTKPADFTGLIDGKAGTIACWFKTLDSGFSIFLANANARIFIGMSGGGTIIIRGLNGAAAIILDLHSTTKVNDGEWHHVVASWDLATTTAKLYLDGVDDTNAITVTNDTIDYFAGGAWGYGAGVSGAFPWTGDFAQLYFNSVAFVDLTVPSNLAKFYSGGVIVDYSHNGATPTGSAPILYLKDTIINKLINQGTGGNFTTETGTVTAATTTPPQESSDLLYRDSELFVVGKKYRYSGYYTTTETIEAELRVGEDIDAFLVNSWRFDATTYISKTSGFTGAVDGRLGTLSFWFKTAGAGPYNIFIGALGRIFIDSSGGNVRVILRDSAGTTLLLMQSSPGYDDGEWHHFVASWNMAATTVHHMYVDGVEDKAFVGTDVAGVIDYTETAWYYGADSFGAGKILMDTSQFYFNTATVVDLSVASNLAKFISPNTAPVSLGADGSLPTGISPILLFQDTHINKFVNSGTGGNFNSVVAGAVLQGSAPPFDEIDSSSIADSGRDLTPTSKSYLSLDRTGGERCRFIFDFIADATSLNLEFKAVGEEGLVTIAEPKLQRIWRYNWYEPRISSSSLPSIETGSNDIFFGGKSIGIGAVSLLNQDGFVEKLIAELEWMNQTIYMDAGGQFSDTQQEILKDNFFRGFTGLIQNIKATDEEVSFELQDQRVFFHIKLPPSLYEDSVFTTMDTRFQGAVRPIFFGIKENISPIRISEDGTSGYGTYEIADTTDSPAGLKQITSVYAYLTESDAEIERVDKRLLLQTALDYTEDLAGGRFSIIVDAGPYEITERDRRLDFDIGAAELTAVLTTGLYTAADLATEIRTQMQGVGSGNETCTYSETTHKFTIGKGAGTLNLLIKTGSNSDSSPYFQLGFDKGSDKTGSLTYEAADAVFSEVDRDHVIRVTASGFKDDLDGTFTGIPSSLIESGADICRVLLVKYMKKSVDIIDETSFLFARQRAPESLSIFLNDSVTTKDIFDRLEFSNIANIVVNGEGKVFYKIYVGDTPADIIDLRDDDLESFSSSRSNSEVYSTIRIKYDQNPTSLLFEAREAVDTSVIVRLGRPDIRELETYVKQGNNATSVAQRMLELARFAARKIEGTSLGFKMLELEVGDKFRLNRKRAIAKGSIIRDEIFRLISISKNPLNGRVSFLATDDRITVASQACIATCQQFCENSCQGSCETACQGVCELTCQSSCEASCQVTCEQGCQETCQLGCQSTCEVSCQVGCQISCQAFCEGPACQTNCEMACQTGCQGVCQTVCQLTTCQGNCEQNCQEGCQLADQTCVITCQTNCQGGNCQETCQLGCQSDCQLGCQSNCQVTGCQAHSETV